MLWLSPPRHLLLCPLLIVSSVSTASAAKRDGDSGTVSVTPHDSYSSSIGVLGCKVDTNRIAYWPNSVDCNNICVSLSYQDRNVHLLRIDQSEGAYDVSYDAWNYLYTGHSATDKPTAGGPVEMQFENVDASKCKDLINTKRSKLPLSAANSMNFLTSCLDQDDTWVGDNYVLYNILDPICTIGRDEACDLDYPAANQASCPHTLGVPEKLDDAPVINIRYPSGEKVRASDGQPARATGLAQPSGKAVALVILLSTCLVFGV
ncbi:hypothetical protein FZEAL_9074 [Fusarium zealandicum]|uniref:Cerato-platanin n=1 Tax=Fusarium zealandicum TaxID=1053134 RepID=A0A8H4XH18_9HYPO|nr:hypothetical protein FZEAL_9074 [Fusarium zealandicum]